MATINLLPWREELRAEKRKEFLSVLGVVLVASLVVLFIWDRYAVGKIDWQMSRNQLLESEIRVLDKQVEEIKALKERRQEMIDRMLVIQNLQANRPEVVKVFDELVRAIPDGLYLEKLQRKGNGVSISGFSESNNRVSSLMRKLDGSSKFADSNLTHVKANDILSEDGSRFEMRAQIRQMATEKNSEEGVSDG